MVKKITKKKGKESPEKENKNKKMTETELKLMVEDLTHLINDNPKHKLYINILHLFKNKDYSSLDYNEIYDYLLIDTKINPLKYSNQEQTEENKPELKARLDLIMNKNCSFKIINKGRKKTIELNLLKAKEYLDAIIHGGELPNEDTVEEKKENENEEEDQKMNDEEKEEVKNKEKEEKKEKKKEEEKEKEEDDDEEGDEDGDEKKQRGRKKKSKRGRKINVVINLNKKTSPEQNNNNKRKRKKRENKKDKENNEQKKTESEIKNENRNENDKMEIEKEEKNINKPEVIKEKNIIFETNKETIVKTEEKDIFTKKLYHEFFTESLEKDLLENGSNKIISGLEQISQTKVDLNILEEKMVLFNSKLSELKLNRLNYEKIKALVDDSQKELYNLYSIMTNEMDSLKILVKINNYNKETYDIHKQTFNKHKESYIKTTEKIKIDISNLKKLEIQILNNKKQIKECLTEINNLFKNVLNNMNIHLLNDEKDKSKMELEGNSDDYINIDLIMDSFKLKKNDIIKEIQKIDEKNINRGKIEEKKEEKQYEKQK